MACYDPVEDILVIRCPNFTGEVMSVDKDQICFYHQLDSKGNLCAVIMTVACLPASTRMVTDYPDYIKERLNDWALTVNIFEGLEFNGLHNEKSLRDFLDRFLSEKKYYVIDNIIKLYSSFPPRKRYLSIIVDHTSEYKDKLKYHHLLLSVEQSSI